METSKINMRKVSIIAGLGLLLMALIAGLVIGIVHNNLIVSNDAHATANNIIASTVQFRLGIFGWLLILILDVIVAWAFYIYLRQTNESLSLLAAWLRLIYTAFLGIAITNLVTVLVVASSGEYIELVGIDNTHAQMMLSVETFFKVWSVGLFLFGLHLLVLGYLLFKSGFIPKLFGVLMLIAAVFYMLTTAGELLIPNYQDYKSTMEMIGALPMAAGELAIAIWLLVKPAISVRKSPPVVI